MKKLTILSSLILTAMFSFADPHSYTVTSNTSWSSKNYSVNDGKASTVHHFKWYNPHHRSKRCELLSMLFFWWKHYDQQRFHLPELHIYQRNDNNESVTVLTLTIHQLNTFTNVNLTASGSGAINATAALTINNSVFTFNNSSYLYNNGGQLNISASTLYFNGNAYLIGKCRDR